MTQYLGDFAEDDVVYIVFNTFTSDDPSASCTITNFVNTDVHIHKDDGLTQRNNAAGITVSTNFDGITGSHLIKIDTNDNTVAGFWVTGKDYFVRIEGTTVDAATINAFVGHFSIQNRYTRGTNSAATAAALTTHDGKLDTVDANVDNILEDTAVIGALGAGLTAVPWNAAWDAEVQSECNDALVALKLDHLIAVADADDVVNDSIMAKIAATGGDWSTFAKATDSLQAIRDRGDSAWPTATGFSTHDAAAVKTAVEAAGSSIALMLEDTSELQGNQAAWATATGFSTHSAADVWSVAARVLTANTNFNDLNAAAIKAEVVAALADIKLDHLLNIAVDTNWATTVHLDSVIGHMADVGTAATFDRTQESMEAIRARGDAAWIAATGFSTHSAADVWSVASRILTANTNLNDPTAAVTAAAVWDKLIADHTGAGSFGLKNQKVVPSETIADYKATGFSTHAAADIWSVGTRALTDKSGFALSTAGIDALWDDLISGMTQVGSIGKLIADNLNATVSSRNSTTPPTVIQIRQEMDTNSTKMAPSQTLADYKATGFNTTTPPTVGEIRTEMEGVGTKLLAIEGDTDELQGNQGNWTTAVGFSTHSAADIWSVGTRALTDKSGFALSATGANLILKDSIFALAMADATWDEILSGATHNIATSAGMRVREIGAFAISSGTAQAGSSNSITLAATADANDGIYNRNLIVLVDNTGVGQTRTIVDYNGTSKVAVIDRDWRTSPDATTTYQVTPDNTPLVVDQGVAQAGTATTITLRSYASSINDTYLCNVIAIIAGTGRGQARLVGAYDGTSKIVTICGDNWVTTPDATSVYAMMPYGTTCTSCIGDHALGLIKSEADDALTDIKLDHLIAVADGDDPVNDSIIAQMAASDGDWSGFAKANDALEAIRNRGDSAWTTATSVTVSDKTGFALSAAGVDAILDENIEGTHTMREMIRLIGAYAAGKSSGGGTATITFRDIDDTKDRIVATVTSVGNRTAVTLTED